MRDEGIHSSMIKFPCDLPCLLQFFRAEKGVQSGINLDAELMGIVAKPVNVLHGIARSHPCTKARSPYVDGICTMIDGCKTAVEVTGRGEKLYDFTIGQIHNWTILFNLIYIVGRFLINVVLYPVLEE